MLTHPGERLCTCGKIGCYEAYASAGQLVRDAAKVDAAITNGREFFERVNAGDKIMRDVLNNWSKEVAIGLVGLTHIFNPSLIVLGGGILEQELALQMSQNEFDFLVMDSFKNVKLEKAQLGNQAGLLGAYSLYINLNNEEKRGT